MDDLVNASNRGIDVKVFIDGSPVGGLTDLARYVAQHLVENGCEVRFIRSTSKDDIHRRYDYLHTKYVVIDNKTVIIMSENWKLSGVPVDNTVGNRGWGVIIRNHQVAEDFAAVFFDDRADLFEIEISRKYSGYVIWSVSAVEIFSHLL